MLHTRTSVQFDRFEATVSAGLRPRNLGRRCCRRLGLPAIRKIETGLMWRRGSHPDTPAAEHTHTFIISSSFRKNKTKPRKWSMQDPFSSLTHRHKISFLTLHERRLEDSTSRRSSRKSNQTCQRLGELQEWAIRRWFFGLLSCQLNNSYNLWS